MIIAYLQKKGLSFYKIKDNTITEIAQKDLSPIKQFFSKKILIISKELLFYTRKTYPPMQFKKLKKALQIDILDLFPISSPDFYVQVFENTQKATIVDIWAWQKPEHEIRKFFPFQYVIPEDVLLTEKDSALKIIFTGDSYHLIAYLKAKFLGTLSVVHLTQKEIELFLTGLLPHSQEIQKIKVYGEIPPDLKFDKPIEKILLPPYPLCLEGIYNVNLRAFKTKFYFPIKSDVLFRVPIYAIIAYGVFLFFTAQNYENAVNDVKAQIAQIEKKTNSIKVVSQENYEPLISEVNKSISQTVSPLTVMNMLALKLPIGCTLNRFVLTEKDLEISLTAQYPLDIIQTLESSEMVKSVKLKGPPTQNTSSHSYNFVLTLELK